MAERWLADLADLVERAEADGIPVFVGEHDVIEALTGFHLHRGALAAMQRPVLPTLAEVLEGARRVLVLEDVVDHTNVGAVFRSAAALGVDAVLVTPRCADPLYRRSIRVSMGTVFQVPWTRIDPWPGGVAQLRELGLHRRPRWRCEDDSVGLDELAADPPERLALVLGTEGDGLSRRTHRRGRPHRAHPDGRRRRLAQRRGGRRRRGLGAAGAGLSRVRIVVSGTHASGKSTLVSDLALTRCAATSSCPTPSSWSMTTSRPGPPPSWRSSPSRPSGWSSCRAGSDVVAERGPVDFLAYLAALAELGAPLSGARPDGPAAVGHGRRRWPTSTCSSCSRSTRPTSSGCRTTRTRS